MRFYRKGLEEVLEKEVHFPFEDRIGDGLGEGAGGLDFLHPATSREAFNLKGFLVWVFSNGVC